MSRRFVDRSDRLARLRRATLLAPVVAAALILAGASSASGNGTAVTLQIDAAHDGIQVDAALNPPFLRRWVLEFSDSVSYPLIAEGKVFVIVSTYPAYGTVLYALDQADGSVTWSQPIPGTYYWSAAAYENGRVFVINFDGVLRAFDAGTGAPEWSTLLSPQYSFSSAPSVSGGVVYVGGAGNGGTLFAVDAADGGVLASQPVQNGDNSSPAISDSAVFVSYACNQTYAFTLVALTPIWRYSGPCSGGGGNTTVYSSGRLFTRDFFGNLLFDAATGSLLGEWGPRNDSMQAVEGDTMWGLSMFTPSGGVLVARDVPTGATLWSFTGDGGLYGTPIVVSTAISKLVVVTSTSGMLYVVNAFTGGLVWSANGGQPLPIYGHGTPDVGLGAGEGLLIVPVGNQLSAYEHNPTPTANCNLDNYRRSKGALVLKNADLRGCYLPNADLANADATNANMTDAYLAGADLSGANLNQARLVRTVLRNADLSGARLSQATLLGADLSGANLTGITWLHTKCPDGTNSDDNGGTCVGNL